MSSRIQIRPFRLSQLQRILEIENAAFPQDPYERDLFLELFQECGDLFITARLSRRIAGYMVTCVKGRRAEIVSIAVDPIYRRAGVGRTMMEYTLEQVKAAGAATLALMVRVSNAEGIAFYRRFEFTRIRKVHEYYENGEDGLLMRKRL